MKKVEVGSRWGVRIKVSGGSYKTIRGMGMEEGTLNVEKLAVSFGVLLVGKSACLPTLHTSSTWLHPLMPIDDIIKFSRSCHLIMSDS